MLQVTAGRAMTASSLAGLVTYHVLETPITRLLQEKA